MKLFENLKQQKVYYNDEFNSANINDLIHAIFYESKFSANCFRLISQIDTSC